MRRAPPRAPKGSPRQFKSVARLAAVQALYQMETAGIGVEAVINGQQERIELVARVLAETGFKDLFTGLYNEIAESPNQRRTLRINGSWTDIDTGAFRFDI